MTLRGVCFQTPPAGQMSVIAILRQSARPERRKDWLTVSALLGLE
jgi:hypothetical protein